ncbi:ATP-binding protein [Nocardioides kribbensis]|uniref:histidine kinase n=2 Tax=Nocardioides kribbensis TaxID=305517 RepID=A0ABV1NXQ4_9ACTN
MEATDETARTVTGDLRPVYQIMRRLNLGGDVASVLDAVAEGAAATVGFAVAAISYLREDATLEIVSVAGSAEAREQLVGTLVPLALMEEELALADAWGSLLFIPAERLADLPTDGWIPVADAAAPRDEPSPDDPDRWRPEDTLRAPLRSPEGELLGLLSVDLPLDGRRPDAARREQLEMYADLAGIALGNARRAVDLAEQVRLGAAVDAINSEAVASLDAAQVVDRATASIAAALRSDWVRVRVVGAGALPGTDHGARFPTGHAETPAPVVAWATREACDHWAAGTVSLTTVSADGAMLTTHTRHLDTATRRPVAGGAAGWVSQPLSPRTDIGDEAERAAVLAHLHGNDLSSMLMAPMGAGTDCFGYVVLARRDGAGTGDRAVPGAVPGAGGVTGDGGAQGPGDGAGGGAETGAAGWSTHEVRAASQVARHLGQAVLNARLLEREHVLVEQLEALDVYKNDLISTVSHELRTPLTSIQGHLELIEDDPAAAPAASFQVVRRNLDRVLSLIDDLLTLKRLTDREATSEAAIVDLHQLAVDAVAAFRLHAQEDGVRLVLQPHGGPLLISGDHDELERVALNLVGNAVKYTPAGGEVTVSVERSERFVRFVCRDTGLGISKPDQEELFTEFFRSTNPEALARPGTGLGLSIVRRIVQRHGGSIRLESELGEGSTFTVRLPLSRL